jgi:uracil-DNA glycosylase
MQTGIENFFKRKQDEDQKNMKKPKVQEEAAADPAENPLEAIEKKSEEVKTLCSLELKTIHPSWLSLLLNEFEKPYFLELKRKLKACKENGQVIYPPENDIYSWTRYCPFQQVKVVILGQDPYHGKGQAHGLAFSVRKGVTPPPSLGNIFKELQSDIPGFKKPNHGNLEGWSRQGVLLLNASLTVQESQPNSHSAKGKTPLGWEKFTDSVIDLLNKRSSHLVFMLWGADAQKKGPSLNQSKHLVLKAPHPSPFSADKGFFGCKHFSKANNFLKKNQIQTIDWAALD